MCAQDRGGRDPKETKRSGEPEVVQQRGLYKFIVCGERRACDECCECVKARRGAN